MTEETGRHKRGEEDPRGRTAPNPLRLPWRGWWESLVRAFKQIGKNNIPIVGAGVAFYAFLSLFPLIVAVVSIYGLISSPSQATEQIGALTGVLPEEARTLLEEQLQRITMQASDSLGWGVALGIFIALWSASRAVKNMMIALNIAYGEAEMRNIFKQALVGLSLTLLITAVVIVALGFIVVVPAILRELPLGQFGKQLVAFSRWPILLVLALVIIGILYRWGPNRADARVSWLTPGAILAAFAWIAASWGFSFFVSRFGNYSETYGSLAAVIILLLWFMISANLVLVGAVLNAELERQTKKDSTTGKPKPMGERGAYAADTLGNRKDGENGDLPPTDEPPPNEQRKEADRREQRSEAEQ